MTLPKILEGLKRQILDGLVAATWSYRRPSRIRLYPRDLAALQREGLTLADVLPTAEWEALRYFLGNIHDELPRNASGAYVLAAVEPTVDRLTARYARRAIGSDRERTVKLVSLGKVPALVTPETEVTLQRWVRLWAAAPAAERRFLAEWLLDPDQSVAAIARRLGYSRKTGYEYLRRIRRRAV